MTGNDTPRVEVQEFARAMERELRANENKGTWKGSDPEFLLERLYEEVAELEHALLLRAPHETVLDEAADVANFAMMIADVVRMRSQPPHDLTRSDVPRVVQQVEGHVDKVQIEFRLDNPPKDDEP